MLSILDLLSGGQSDPFPVPTASRRNSERRSVVMEFEPNESTPSARIRLHFLYLPRVLDVMREAFDENRKEWSGLCIFFLSLHKAFDSFHGRRKACDLGFPGQVEDASTSGSTRQLRKVGNLDLRIRGFWMGSISFRCKRRDVVGIQDGVQYINQIMSSRREGHQHSFIGYLSSTCLNIKPISLGHLF